MTTPYLYSWEVLTEPSCHHLCVCVCVCVGVGGGLKSTYRDLNSKFWHYMYCTIHVHGHSTVPVLSLEIDKNMDQEPKTCSQLKATIHQATFRQFISYNSLVHGWWPASLYTHNSLVYGWWPASLYTHNLTTLDPILKSSPFRLSEIHNFIIAIRKHIRKV